MMSTATKPNGSAVAAVLAAATGVFLIGFLNTAGEFVGTIRNVLTWNRDIGSVTGKVGVAVVVWLLMWALLGASYRGRNVDAGRLLMISWVLIVVGFVLTLPFVASAVGGLR
jgi:hypothetical protein